MKRFLISLIFLFSPFLQSEPDVPIIQAATEGDPSTICENVSLLTGDYIQNIVDYVVPGAEPIYLTRQY